MIKIRDADTKGEGRVFGDDAWQNRERVRQMNPDPHIRKAGRQ